jgi:hypothetical protein
MRTPKAKTARRAAAKLLVVEVQADSGQAASSFSEALQAASSALAEGRNLDTTIKRDGAVARVKVKHR